MTHVNPNLVYRSVARRQATSSRRPFSRYRYRWIDRYIDR